MAEFYLNLKPKNNLIGITILEAGFARFFILFIFPINRLKKSWEIDSQKQKICFIL